MNDLQMHPLHEGTGVYAMACFLSREQQMDSAEIRKFAEWLMYSIAAASIRRGAKVIGHIKAYIEHEHGFLHANTVGEPDDVTVDGRDGGPVRRFKLVVNSIIFGLSEETVKNAAEEGVTEASTRFGLKRESAGPEKT